MSVKRFAATVAGSTLAAAAAFGLTALSPIAPTAHAAGFWAAIAYSPPEGAYGYVFLHDSKQAALDAAFGFCIQYGGTACEMAAVAQTGCLALATSGAGWHGGLGTTKAAAEADALNDNGGGTIAVSGCTGA